MVIKDKPAISRKRLVGRLKSNRSFVVTGLLSTVLTGLDFVKNDLVGLNERAFEVGGDLVEAGSANCLFFTSNLGSLDLKSSLSVDLSLLNILSFELAGSLGVGVESLHHGSVLERVLLGLVVGSDGSSNFAEFGLNLIGVDDSGEIGAVHHVLLEVVSTLFDSSLVEGSEDGVKSGESILGEDNESSEVTTRGELEEVKSVDGASVNTHQVTGGSLEERVLISVDEEGSLSDDEAGASHLTGSVSGSLGFSSADEVVVGTNLVKGLEKSTGALNVKRVDNKREFGDGLNGVTSGLNKRSAGGSSKS